ncbi:hypothetical protein ABZX30_14470 [Streptomyces sp. NPDC004542]|uniref:hypothetical protein n=1 Tax=Streptomyces sp. NPDC004542 TaxID=3154281 RepID=UPI0033A75CC0
MEAKLMVEGDPSPGTLTRTWTGDAFTGSEAVLKRPGHGTVPLEQAGWEQATRNHRPFLSYADLGNMINGKPSQMYDSIAGILGLEYLNAASRRLTEQRKELEAVEKAEKEKKPLLLAALEAVEHDDRALRALVAVEERGGPDYGTLDALIAGVPMADEGRRREARLEADAKGPDLDRVGAAVDALQRAVADADDLKGSAAADALGRAELLQAALAHSDRHADDTACPVCGTEQVLDRAWAARRPRLTVLCRSWRTWLPGSPTASTSRPTSPGMRHSPLSTVVRNWRRPAVPEAAHRSTPSGGLTYSKPTATMAPSCPSSPPPCPNARATGTVTTGSAYRQVHRAYSDSLS